MNEEKSILPFDHSYHGVSAPLKRKCIGCGEIKPRKNMIRIMKTYDTNEIIIMPSSTHFGRSSYLCYNNECLKHAIKKRRLQKTLKKDIPISIINDIAAKLEI